MSEFIRSKNTISVIPCTNGTVINIDDQITVYTKDESVEALLQIAIEMGLSVGVYKEGDQDNYKEHYCCRART